MWAVLLIIFAGAACAKGSSRPVELQIRSAYESARRAPSDPGAHGRLGQILHAYEQFEAAAACYQRAHLLDPSDFRWLYFLGSVQASALQHGKAGATFREALKLDPKNVLARLQLGKSLLMSGELTSAEELFSLLSREQPSMAEVWYGLARTAAAQGKKQLAVGRYRAACKLMPDYGAAHYGLALALRDLGAGIEAEEHFALYRRYQNNSPEVDDPLLKEVHALRSGDALEALRKGVLLESKGQLEESAREQERAIEIDPSLAQAHINLVALYGRLGQPARAGEHFQKALSQRPNQTDLHYNYGIVLAGEGRIPEAESAFRRALAINPSHRLAHFQIGRVLVARNQHQEAIEHFRSALSQQDEQTPLVLFGLATAYAGSGSAQDALLTARKAREQAASMGQAQLVTAIDRDFPENSR